MTLRGGRTDAHITGGFLLRGYSKTEQILNDGCSLSPEDLRPLPGEDDDDFYFRTTGIPVLFQPSDFVKKRNRNSTLNELEFKVISLLQNEPLANFVSVQPIDDSSFNVEYCVGPSLYEETIYNIDQMKKSEIFAKYKTLVSESMHISHILTSRLSEEMKQQIVQEKFSAIQSASSQEAQKNYHTLKLQSALGVDVDMKEIQDAMNAYAAQHAVWISDRSPKNRKNKNFDANKIDFAPLTTELTLILDMVPGYFSREEREELLHYGLGVWNDITQNNLQVDKDFLVAYDADCFYRATLNAAHSAREAKKLWNTENFSIYFFDYARLIEDAHHYFLLAQESLRNLIQNDVLPYEKAASLDETIREGLHSKLSFVDEDDYATDLEICYKGPYLLEWYALNQTANPSNITLSHSMMQSE